MTSTNLELVEYSERSLAIFGETKLYKEQLKALGGKYNSSLTYDGHRQAGWIFSKSKYDDLATFITECEPDAEVEESNGLLSSGGVLTSTGKQFLANKGEKTATLTNKRTLTKPATKVSPKKAAPVKKTNVSKYEDIELDKVAFKEVKKGLKHHISVHDPDQYGQMLPGEKITFFDGVDTLVSRKVISVLKVASLAHIEGRYEDLIVLEGLDNESEYVVILEF